MNILIAVPSMDSVPAVFAQSLSMLKKVGNCAVAFQVGSLVYNSRNALGKRALEMVLAIYKSAAEHRPIKLPLENCSTMDFVGRFN